jgi:adenylate cyclase
VCIKHSLRLIFVATRRGEMLLSALRNQLVKWNLTFADPADEAEFVERHVRGWIPFAQGFLILGALFYYLFFMWDDLIDPVNSPTTHLLRGLVFTPILVITALSLFTAWGRKHVEVLILISCILGQAGLAIIYTILDGGYNYAAVAFLLMFVGTASAFPFRSKLLIYITVFVLISGIVGHLYADNARPGWLLVNIMVMMCGLSFGSLSAYFRERGARLQFVTDRALEDSRARVDELLFSILPRDIVQRIQSGESDIAESLGEVTIVFADLAGFTELARKLSPSDLVKVLAKLFSAFDKEAERFGIDRIKTIGDAYMAISGISRAVSRDHVEDAADFAIAVLAAVHRIQRETGYEIDVRIGLHVGPVVAGVIGRRRPAFDCWGESVNLASRLESNAPRGGILVSESVYKRLNERFDVEPGEAIELKGIGLTKVFVLRSRQVEKTALRLVG